jgi:uroporphyrinogen decarboxylase
MTPRQQAIAVLSRQRPKGLVPHLELEFQLSEELVGVPALRAEHLQGVTGPRREDMLKRNAEHWVEVAKRLDYCVITGTHWLDHDDQIKTFQYLRDIAGDTYLLSAFVDGTFSIPTGENMMEQAVYFIECREQALADADGMAEAAITKGVELIQAGAEVVFMCADYCFNDGPFLSPRMFREFVTPSLKRQVDAFRAAGAFTVKHTDGDIMPILDQLVEAGPDALHSLDPMAGVDIKRVREIVGNRLCLIGNVNLAYVQQGPPEKIADSARYCLKHGGVSTGAYIYSTSNCIFQGVPMENYELMLRVREEYGGL